MVGCASSFGASSVQQEIGLGDALRITSIAVDWPVGGTTQTFADVPLDRIVDLTEGDPQPKIAEARPFHRKADAAACCPPRGDRAEPLSRSGGRPARRSRR